MCGGKGMMPWLQTTLYQYVVDKYGITPDAPGIRKPDSNLLPVETDEPTLDMLLKEDSIYAAYGNYVMIMRVIFPVSSDSSKYNYITECLYRTCGFSGSTANGCRTYEDFMESQ